MCFARNAVLSLNSFDFGPSYVKSFEFASTHSLVLFGRIRHGSSDVPATATVPLASTVVGVARRIDWTDRERTWHWGDSKTL